MRDVSYNGHTVVVNVRAVVQFLLNFGMLMSRPRRGGMVSPSPVPIGGRGGYSSNATYSTPVGCNAVWFTRAAMMILCSEEKVQ